MKPFCFLCKKVIRKSGWRTVAEKRRIIDVHTYESVMIHDMIQSDMNQTESVKK